MSKNSTRPQGPPLYRRLGELRGAGVAELDPDGGCRLTAEGVTLLAALSPLHDSAARWARRR